MNASTPAFDIDGAWKEALREYLMYFFALCFPAVYRDIDWSRGFEFLDKELQKIVGDSQTGRRSVDLLIRVWRRGGQEQWVLIHVEIQAQYDASFPERMCEYFFRIRDRYGAPVASFAVLADDNPNWRPDRMTYDLWGCSVDFRFPSVKLTDFAADTERLEKSDNPFAVIILAHLKAMQTSGDPEMRRTGKVRLIKSLYDRWGRDDVRKLVRLIDWLVKLPKNLEVQVRDEIETFEQEKQMPFITSFERLAMEEGEARGEARGLQDGIARFLRFKFGEAGTQLMEEVRKINDLTLLNRIFESVERSTEITEIRRTWTQ